MDFRQAILARMAQKQGQTRPGSPLTSTPGLGQPQASNPMDPRGLMGILSRGSNVYNSGSSAAQRGGPNIGRPNLMQAAGGRNAGGKPAISREAIGRRLGY